VLKTKNKWRNKMIETNKVSASVGADAQADKTTDVKTENASNVLNPSEGRERAYRHMQEHSLAIPSTQMSIRERVREELRYDEVENVVIFDAKGNEVRRVRGTGCELRTALIPDCFSNPDVVKGMVAEVKFSDDDTKILESVGAVLLHNHPYPDREIFSKMDIATFLANPALKHLKEMEVVNIDGSWIIERNALIHESKVLRLVEVYSNYLVLMSSMLSAHPKEVAVSITAMSDPDRVRALFLNIDAILLIGAVRMVCTVSNGRLILSHKGIDMEARNRVDGELELLDQLEEYVDKL
jgi:hypothetical protein